jgi:hypothetical protein
MNKQFKIFLFSTIISCGVFSFNYVAAAVLEEAQNFYLDSSYDFQGRNETSAILVLESTELYIYIDNSLWQPFSESERNKIILNL